MDREKAINGLECHRIDEMNRINCSDCPYYESDDNFKRCLNNLHDDTLALLFQQEAEIRQLRLAIDIVKGTCKGIVMEG